MENKLLDKISNVYENLIKVIPYLYKVKRIENDDPNKYDGVIVVNGNEINVYPFFLFYDLCNLAQSLASCTKEVIDKYSFDFLYGFKEFVIDYINEELKTHRLIPCFKTIYIKYNFYEKNFQKIIINIPIWNYSLDVE
jgi:hypothetical protein